MSLITCCSPLCPSSSVSFPSSLPHKTHSTACIQSLHSLPFRARPSSPLRLSGPASHRLLALPGLDQAWGTSIDTETLWQTLPQNLFAFSIVPYAGFLWYLHRSKQAPPLTLFGFYFLLVFVFATIPAGIYVKKVYGTNLANVDYLHGSAEFLLTLTNLFIVVGLRRGIREAEQKKLEQRVIGEGQEQLHIKNQEVRNDQN